MMTQKALMAVVLAILFVTPSRGEVIIQPIVDTLVAKADVICVGQVVSVETRHVRSRIWVEKVGLRVTDSIHGSVMDKEVIYFAFRVEASGPSCRDLLFSEKGALVMLRPTTPQERELDSTLTPISTHRPITVFDLDSDNQKFCFTHEYGVISKGEALLDAVKVARERKADYQRAARERGESTEIKFRGIWVPFDTEAHDALYTGSMVTLIIPTYMPEPPGGYPELNLEPIFE